MKTRANTSTIAMACIVFFSGIELLAADEYQAGTQRSENTTTVYKVINPDGSISFSDVPQDKAEVMEVAPVTTIPAIDIKQNTPLKQMPIPVDPDAYYRELAVTYPANGAVFHSGDGNIPVSVTVTPPLKQGDAFILLLNQQPVATQQAMKFNLKHVSRGTHTLTLQIIDDNEKIIESTSSNFTLHRPKKAR